MKGMKRIALFSLLMFTAGCATTGIFSPQPPTIRFLNFSSLTITPLGVQFEAKMAVHNTMPIRLPLKAIDYQFDLNNRRFMTGSFTDLKELAGYGEQVVTFPFQISFADLVLQSVVLEHHRHLGRQRRQRFECLDAVGPFLAGADRDPGSGAERASLTGRRLAWDPGAGG